MRRTWDGGGFADQAVHNQLRGCGQRWANLTIVVKRTCQHAGRGTTTNPACGAEHGRSAVVIHMIHDTVKYNSRHALRDAGGRGVAERVYCRVLLLVIAARGRQDETRGDAADAQIWHPVRDFRPSELDSSWLPDVSSRLLYG